MRVRQVLETVLYAPDLDAAQAFYEDVLGLVPFVTVTGRHVFYKLDTQVFLLFNPEATEAPPLDDALPVPPHGARGAGHVCFTASAAELDAWVHRLTAADVEIEADFLWPQGGRSIYFRDPAGNCLEFSESRIWGFSS